MMIDAFDMEFALDCGMIIYYYTAVPFPPRPLYDSVYIYSGSVNKFHKVKDVNSLNPSSKVVEQRR